MNDKIKTLQIIHLAICVGAAMAYFFVGNLSIESLKIKSVDSSNAIYFAIPVLAFILSNLLFKSQLRQADPKLMMEDKFPIYQTASIIRWGILEGAAFIILFIKPDMLLLGVLIIAFLAFLRPTVLRMANDFSNVT